MEAVKLGGDSCFINLTGELITSDEKPLLEACRPVVKGGPAFVILGLAGVSRINGLGASMLVKLYILFRKRGRRMLF